MVQPALKQRLLAGGFWVLTGKVVTASSRLLAMALLARLLSQETMGAFGLALSVVTGGAMVGQLGLQQAVVRLVAESLGTGRPGRARASVGMVFRYCGLGNLAVVAVMLLGGGSWLAIGVWDSPLLAASMVGIAVWIVVTSFQVLVSETFRGFQDLRSATLFGGVITWALALLLLAVVWVSQGKVSLDWVILIMIATTAFSLLLGTALLSRRVRRLGGTASLGRGELFSLSLPLWINVLTAFALAQFDLWILGAFIPKASVAIYFAAMQLVVLVSMSLMLVNLVVPPFIADLYARGEKKRLERILRHTATLAGVPAMLALLAFVFFGAPILELVFGEGFQEGAMVLALLSLGKMVNVLTGSCGVTMSMTGHQTALMGITVFTSACTVCGCLLVVQSHGMVGVASVVCAGTIFQNVAMWLGTKYYTGLWTHLGFPSTADIKALFVR
jgi:O-antigen/teichoic acid export membrane protein